MKLTSHEEVSKDHDFLYMIMPDEKNKMLKYTQHLKYIGLSFLIYKALESLIKKIICVKINQNNHSYQNLTGMLHKHARLHGKIF